MKKLAKVYVKYCPLFKGNLPWLVMCLEANFGVHVETEEEAIKLAKFIERYVEENNIKAHPRMDEFVNETD